MEQSGLYSEVVLIMEWSVNVLILWWICGLVWAALVCNSVPLIFLEVFVQMWS